MTGDTNPTTPACARCGGRWPTLDNIQGSTFWGMIRTAATTQTTRTVRIWGTWVRNLNDRASEKILRWDEETRLCSDCNGLLVGRFLQGRDVPAIPSKVGK